MSSSVDGQVFFTESFETTGDYTAGSAGDCSCVTADADAIDGQNDHFADVTDADITHNFIADYTGELDASGNALVIGLQKIMMIHKYTQVLKLV